MYECVSGQGDCQVSSVTRSNCKKCRFERCLAVGMRPELVDNLARRKEREHRKERIEKSDEKTFDDCMLEITSPHTQTESQIYQTKIALREYPEKISSEQCKTFYLFDPRKNIYQPIYLVSELANLDNAVLIDTPVKEFNNETNEIEATACVKENFQKQEHIDIESMVEDCFLEELNAKSAATDEISNQSSLSILPLKKRKSDLISTPFYKEDSLTPCFTLEEEFRLHDLIVRRDAICEETIKFSLEQAPSLLTSMYKEFSRAMEKNRKIIFSESFFDFYFTKGRQYASQMFKENFEELKDLDQAVAYR